jgi:hypothetical protein
VDLLQSRLLLSGTTAVIAPSDTNAPAASGPTAVAVITPMDPVPVGYSDDSSDPSAASGPTSDLVITPMDSVPIGYSDNSPSWGGPVVSYVDPTDTDWDSPAASPPVGNLVSMSPDPSSPPASGPTDSGSVVMN